MEECKKKVKENATIFAGSAGWVQSVVPHAHLRSGPYGERLTNDGELRPQVHEFREESSCQRLKPELEPVTMKARISTP